MQNKFPDNDNFFAFPFVSALNVCLYNVDIKSKSHFWPTSNMTEKIDFVSQVVQICEPETFGLLPQN